jgi:hypothetical protein
MPFDVNFYKPEEDRQFLMSVFEGPRAGKPSEDDGAVRL